MNEFNPLIFELMKKAIKGCCSDNINSKDLDEVLEVLMKFVFNLSQRSDN